MSSSSTAAPDPTEIAGRYDVEKKLGAGAFGTVFKAKDRELGRMVAIKTIRLEGLAASTASLDDLVKRFRQEAQVAARLRHPNIVMLYDIGTWQGMSYISMEFVDGVGLDRVIKTSGKMAMERAAAIGAQVADALAVAHKSGVVHRDIKPANIMIEPGDHVKVTDFGIAKLTDSAEHLTVTGSLLGTPSYMSPEQARGGAVDGRSDLFSVGCVLYEMVAGQRAFRGDSITALLFKIITEEPPSLRELDPTVSDEMLRIIGKALAKTPETRYQNGRELADDLLALTRPGFMPTLRAREAPTLPPDTPPVDIPTLQSPPTHRPEPTIASKATVAGGPGLAATVLTPPTAPGAPPPLPGALPPIPRPPAPPKSGEPAARRPQAEAPRRKGGGAGLVIGLVLAGLLLVAVVVGGGLYLMRGAPESTDPIAQTTPSPAPTEATATPASSGTAEAPPVDTPATPTPTLAAETRPEPETGRATPRPQSTTGAATSRPEPPPARSTSTALAPPETARGGNGFGHLDELPSAEPDGRAAAEALSKMYSGGSGSGSGSSARFRERPRIPRGVVPAERPAVATLLYLHTVEQAYQRSNGRYGTLQQLKDSGLLALDVPVDAGGFRRERYAFRLSVEPDGFRAEAVPQGPVGRAFVVDDTGKVREADE